MPTKYRHLAAGTFGRYSDAERDPGHEVHVNANELDASMALARTFFEAKLRECVTTFYLEPKDPYAARDSSFAVSDSYIDGKRAVEALHRMPFSCLRIVQTVLPFEGDGLGPIESEVICYGDGTKFGWVAKDRQLNSGVTAYSPTGLAPSIDNSMPMAYLYLMEALTTRTARGIEKPVTRQVRRASGFGEGYKEFIIIRKPNAAQRATMMRMSEIIRRHPRLHAVRGHLRHYESGLVTFVKAHARGGDKTKREVFQVKDYIADEARYTEG